MTLFLSNFFSSTDVFVIHLVHNKASNSFDRSAFLNFQLISKFTLLHLSASYSASHHTNQR